MARKAKRLTLTRMKRSEGRRSHHVGFRASDAELKTVERAVRASGHTSKSDMMRDAFNQYVDYLDGAAP